MKVRIGIGVANETVSSARLAEVVHAIDTCGFDSIWLSENLTSDVVDPLVALAWAGARHPRLKLGTTMLLPGRNLLHVAKQIATLDHLSGGRLLVTLVPGLATEPERSAIGVPMSERAAVFEDSLPLLRRLWRGETVTDRWAADGAATDETHGVTLSPLPTQQPFEVWLTGMTDAALRRCGRLGDGWLPARCTPEEAAAGRATIETAAAEAGRSISAEHYGVSIGYAHGPLPEPVLASLRRRARGRPVHDLVPMSLDALRDLIGRFTAVGFSKFVARPLVPPSSWDDELGALAAAVGDLQT